MIGETVSDPLTLKLKEFHRQWIMRDAAPLPFARYPRKYLQAKKKPAKRAFFSAD